MKFRDFVFPAEPAQLQTTCRRRVTESAFPAGDKAADGGALCRVISGKGVFMGADARGQFEALGRAMAAGGPGVLCLPGQRPFLALAEKLELTGKQHPNAVGYAFSFVEVQPQKESLPAYVYAEDGETLWDIAGRYGRNMDDLVRVNPHIPKIRCLKAGERVFVAAAGEA